MYRVALVSMPFAAIEYPSLALGLFKSRLDRDGVPCDVHYLNISFAEMVGYTGYNTLVTQPPAYFAAEQVFAEAAFGSLVRSDQAYYDEAQLGPSVRRQLQAVKALVEPFLARCLAEIDWRPYDIIGFTSLFEQNLATLALAGRLKQLYPEKLTVFGGPNFEAVMGRTFHRLLGYIDFVCSGESDDTFPELIKRLSYNHPIDDLPGVVYRRNGVSRWTGDGPMTTRLDQLPIPDFDGYFARIRQFAMPPGADPCVLLETSRGCWWGEKSHCTFCGLNSQSMEYRSKSADRAVAEVEELKNRYGVNFVRVVDNILNHSFFDDFIPSLARKKLGVTVFFEVKANLRKHQIRMLGEAGVNLVQAGIESLSTHTLKLMRKGSTALMNVQTLKWCKEYGVRCDWNLIYGFPGEHPEDYRSSVELARVLTHLDPPTGCGGIRLDRFSPNYDHAAKMGLRNVRPMKWYGYLYPFSQRDLHDVAYYFDFDYAETIDDGGHLPALHEAAARWKQSQDQLYAVLQGDDVVIRDSRPVARAAYTVLSGFDRQVFELCDQITTVRRIEQVLAKTTNVTFPDNYVRAVVDDLIARHLVVCEDDRLLALPVLTYTPVQQTAALPAALLRAAQVPTGAAHLVSA
jgi:ribosomal peptide maturation radical SAM protein 1